MRPILIYGAGQVAQVFAGYLTDARYRYTVAGFVVGAEYWPSTPAFIGESPVVPFEQVGKVTFLPTKDYRFVIGMSFTGLNAPRAAKYEAMLAKGYEPLTFVDSEARPRGSPTIGRGSFVMDGNSIQPGVSIGENCILWSGNHIGHHTKIGNHVFIASHAVISGDVEIGDHCFIGVNATIRDGVTIGPRCVIGAGALILSDCEADGVYSPGGTERSRVPSSRLRRI